MKNAPEPLTPVASLRRAFVWGALAGVAACSYVPAHFADRPPVERAPDDTPISVPLVRRSVEGVLLADVHIRRALVGALDPRRTPDARDVNAVDEVVNSSWFERPRDPHHPLAGCTPDGPPEEPLVAADVAPASGTPGTVAVKDARGVAYELSPDEPGHPTARTGAEAVASRLFCALGYRTPEVWIAYVSAELFQPPHHTLAQGEAPVFPDANGRVRVAARRWPIGVDLGATPMRTTRPDDPNDVVPHLDRRSLRALQMFTAWLRLDRVEPRMLRDAYVGAPAFGHVQHFLVGLGGALGIDTLRAALAEADNPDRVSSTNFFFRLFTLGVSPKPDAPSTKTAYPSVGLVDEQLAPEVWSLAPPYEPGDKLLGADAYWAAKHLGALPQRTVSEAVASAKLATLDASYWLVNVLEERRRVLMRYGYERTSPLEVATIEPGSGAGTGTDAGGDAPGATLVIADLAVNAGLGEPMHTSYELELLDDAGALLAPLETIAAHGATFRVPLARALLAAHPYVIVRVTSLTDEEARPRALEAHVTRTEESVRLLGVRH